MRAKVDTFRLRSITDHRQIRNLRSSSSGISSRRKTFYSTNKGIRYHLNNDKGLEIKWLQPYQAIISGRTDHDQVLPCPHCPNFSNYSTLRLLLDGVVCVLPASCIWLTGSQRSFCTWSSVGLRTCPPRRRAYRHPRDPFHHDHGGFRERARQSLGHR